MRITIRSVCIVGALLASASLSLAQDKPDAAKPDTSKLKPAELKVTEEPKAPDEKPEVAWKKALDRKLEIFNKLQQLKKDFSKAEGKEAQSKVRTEYVDLIREFEVDVYPKMIDLAAVIYKANPDEQDAAEIVMQKAFNENQFELSDEIATKLLAANRKTKAVVSTAAISQFAVHKFAEASGLLTEADANDRLHDQYKTYIDPAKKYIDAWKHEEALRAAEAKLEGDKALPLVEIETSKGKIVVELFEDQAPNTVANFISLAEGKKYDGIAFHRVLNGFMAQGGDPNTLNDDPLDDGQGGPGYTIKCECYRPDARLHFRGSLSMAHAGKDSGGSQFFITHLPTHWLNPTKTPTERGHTVFGRVVEGMEIAMSIRRGDKITSAVVTRKRPHEYKPEVTADPSKQAEKPEETKTDAKKSEEKKTDSKSEKEPETKAETKSEKDAESK